MPIPSTVLYSVTVDTEEEWDWNGDYPTTDLRLTNIACLPELQSICNRHGAAVTYFTNYAVLADPVARRIILDLARQPRVEIGMHIHPWNTPPYSANGQVFPRDTFLHNLPADLIWKKLETVYNLFLECGLRPTSFRGGRYSSGDIIQDFLRRKGFVADASVVPYSSWPDEGAPDYRHRRLIPSRLAPSQAGDKALWELPLTMGFTRRPFSLWHRIFEIVANSPLRHLRLIGIADRLGIVQKAWLNIESPLGQRPVQFLRVLRKLHLPYIDFCLHSSSLITGGNSFTLRHEDRDRTLSNLSEALACVAAWNEFRSVTVSEAASYLEETYARSGN